MTLFPATLIIATLERRSRLLRTLQSVLAQNHVPAEWVIVDASMHPIGAADLPPLPPGVICHCLLAHSHGAAAQRNQGFAVATQPHVLWLDDDVDLEPGCLRALWQCLESDATVGGCGAVLTNSRYHPPGPAFRRALGWFGCPTSGELAGRCCGPALNFLPAEANTEGVDWLNLGCVLYRRTALPQPPFLPFFQGYSLMEDVALSLEVSRRWKLRCPAGARIVHDPLPARYKDDVFGRERMEVINRWFVMRMILDRRGVKWAMRQTSYQLLMLVASLRSTAAWKRLPFAVAGKLSGLFSVLRHRHEWQGYASTCTP